MWTYPLPSTKALVHDATSSHGPAPLTTSTWIRPAVTSPATSFFHSLLTDTPSGAKFRVPGCFQPTFGGILHNCTKPYSPIRLIVDSASTDRARMDCKPSFPGFPPHTPPDNKQYPLEGYEPPQTADITELFPNWPTHEDNRPNAPLGDNTQGQLGLSLLRRC